MVPEKIKIYVYTYTTNVGQKTTKAAIIQQKRKRTT